MICMVFNTSQQGWKTAVAMTMVTRWNSVAMITHVVTNYYSQKCAIKSLLYVHPGSLEWPQLLSSFNLLTQYHFHLLVLHWSIQRRQTDVHLSSHLWVIDTGEVSLALGRAALHWYEGWSEGVIALIVGLVWWPVRVAKERLRLTQMPCRGGN